MEKETVGAMALEALRQLDAIRRPGAKAKAKEWAKGLLGRGNALGQDPVFWPAGLLLLGLTEAGHIQEAEEYLAEWMRKGAIVQNPDDALTGSVILDLYERTGKDCYRKAADRVAAYLYGCLRDENSSVIYGQRSGNTWIYADGTGMTAMFLARYGRICGEDAAAYHAEIAENAETGAGKDGGCETACAVVSPLADARRQLANYAALGMDARSGLPYHGYEACSGVKLGIIGWGRAVGWLLLGLSEYVLQENCVPDSGRTDAPRGEGDTAGDTAGGAGGADTAGADAAAADASAAEESRQIHRMLRSVCDAVYQRIRPDGMLSWQLDCVDGPLDTSATGMIFYSLLRMNRFLASCHGGKERAGVREDCLPEIPRTDPALINAAAEGLRSCVDERGRVLFASAECADFSQYRQQYGTYPWGQGAVLAFLALYDRPAPAEIR